MRQTAQEREAQAKRIDAHIESLPITLVGHLFTIATSVGDKYVCRQGSNIANIKRLLHRDLVWAERLKGRPTTYQKRRRDARTSEEA